MTPKERMFPILGDPILKALPWSLLVEHEAQAQRNHIQSLDRLASRGGLGPCEAYCVLKDRSYPTGGFKSQAAIRVALMRLLYEAELSQEGGDA